jgi:1-aminocyclopropane-1-carboxylate deaminase
MLLQEIFHKFISSDYNIHTRIHPVNSYIQANNAKIFIKREDELSSGISGSKFRKFASLIPFLKANNYDEIAVIGGAYSNNVVAALQLLNETRIAYKLFLLESHQHKPAGNLLWIKMLIKNTENVAWIKREEWINVESIAENYAEELLKNQRKKVFVLKEGAAVKEALPGAMTIADDILLNEKQLNKSFEHIFIDSGTATSAIGLILGLQYLNACKNRKIYITLIAGDEEFFQCQLDKFTKEIQEYTGIKLPANKCKLHFLKPATAASFGAINTTVLEETIKMAKTEGILMEPVYSVKHFYTAKRIIEKEKLHGNILVINNGGSLGLTGFQERLADMIKD